MNSLSSQFRSKPISFTGTLRLLSFALSFHCLFLDLFAGKEIHDRFNHATKGAVYQIDERAFGEPRSHPIPVKNNNPGDRISGLQQIELPIGNSAFKLHQPSLGTVGLDENDPEKIIYTPFVNAEGYERFTFTATTTGGESNRTVEIKIKPIKQRPDLYLSSADDADDWTYVGGLNNISIPFHEESDVGRVNLIVVDPDYFKYSDFEEDDDFTDMVAANPPLEDPPNEFNATIISSVADNDGSNLFRLRLVDTFRLPSEEVPDIHGWAKRYEVVWTGSGVPNYEVLNTLTYSVILEVKDELSVFKNASISIIDVNDPPKILDGSDNSDQTKPLQEFNSGTPAVNEFSLSLREEDNDGSFYWRVERILDPGSDLDGDVENFPDLSTITIDNGSGDPYEVLLKDTAIVQSHESSVSFEDDVTIKFVHDKPDLFGKVQYLFTPYELNSEEEPILGETWKVTIDLQNDDADHISLSIDFDALPDGSSSSGSLIVKEHQEVADGVLVWDFNTTDPDSHPSGDLRPDNSKSRPGAKIIYSLTGPDAEFFNLPDSNGIFTFKKVPDFENKRDDNRDNAYEVTVRARDGGEGGKETDTSQSFKVQVVNLEEPPLLVSGDGNYSRVIRTREDESWDSSVKYLESGNTVSIGGQLYYALQAYDPDGSIPSLEEPNQGTSEVEWIAPGAFGANGSTVVYESSPLPRIIYTPGIDFAGEEIFEMLINEVGSSPTDGNSTTSVYFTAIVEPQPDPPFVQFVTGMGQNFDGVGVSTFEVPIPEHPAGEVALILTFNEITDVNETFESVILEDGSANFELTLDPDNPNNSLVRKLTLLRSRDELDYENPTMRTLTATLLVRERGDNGAPTNKLFFNFNLVPEDEPPVLFDPVWGVSLLDNEVREEQTFIARLQAADPEDSNATLTWVLPNTNQNTKYQFSNGSSIASSKNPVLLEFKSPQSYETQKEYNATIYVYDTPDQTGQSNQLDLAFSLVDVNEPPKLKEIDGEIPDSINLQILEGEVTDVVKWNLYEYFVDEDGDAINFSRVPVSDEDYGMFIISSGLLSFSKPQYSDAELFSPDHIGAHYKLTVSGSNTGSLDNLEVQVNVRLLEFDEPPEVKRTTDGRLLSDSDPLANEKITIIVAEDADVASFSFSDLNLSIYDPERVSNIDIEVVGYDRTTFDGTLSDGGYFFISDDVEIDYENNDTTFSFKPPPDTFGFYPIDLNLSDGVEQSNSYFTLEFYIQDTPDPPNVAVVNPLFDANSTDLYLYEKIIKVPEGSLKVIELSADDLFDEPDPTQSFYWQVNYQRGDDAELFKQFSTASSPTKTLYWNESHPNLNYKPSNEDSDLGKASPVSLTTGDLEYRFSITVKELIFDSDETNTRTVHLHLGLVDADTPPAFIEPNASKPNVFAFAYQELSPSLVVGEINATDYDNEEKDDNFTLVSYTKLQGYDGWLFDVNGSTGELSFQEAPDYENPKDVSTVSGDNVYEVLIGATEYWTDESGGLIKGPSTNQLYEVHLINTIELPKFVPAVLASNDANFSLDEHQDYPGPFEINATTEDAYPVQGIEMMSGKDAALFEVVSNLSQGIVFKFKRSPDYENPRDGDFDNVYEVDFKILTGSVSSDVNETFLIKVNDLISSLRFVNKDGSTNFEYDHYENQKLVVDLDVIDVEGENYVSKDYPDLFAVTETGAYYATNTREENSTDSLYSGNMVGDFTTISEESAWISVSEDFNNDGSLDAIVLKRNEIEVYLNDGLGFFELYQESNFTHPDFAISDIRGALAVDLDANGMVDLIVASPGTDSIHIFQNKSGAPAFKEFGVDSKRLTLNEHLTESPEHLAASDIDGDADLDLVLTSSPSGEVVWLENQGSLTFTYGGKIAEPSKFLQALEADGLNTAGINGGFSGIGKIQAVDISEVGNLGDPFTCRDLLIPAKHGIYLAYNDGHGGFSLKVIARYGLSDTGFSGSGGAGVIAKGVDLRRESIDHFTDFIYLTSDSNVPYFVLQRSDGAFDSPVELFPESKNDFVLEDDQKMKKPNLLETYRSSTDQFVLVSGSQGDYVYVFQSRYLDQDPWVKFTDDDPNWKPTMLDFGSNVRHVGIADLDKKSNFIRFSISDDEDGEDFDDVIIASGGKLVFSEVPDYENPQGVGASKHEYIIPVTASIQGIDGSILSSATEFVLVNLMDANDPPEFEDFIQNGISINPDQRNYVEIDHPANVLEIFESVSFSNQESDTLLREGVTLSVSPNADGHLFEIEPDTGRFAYKDDHAILGQGDAPSSDEFGYVSFDHLPADGQVHEVWIRATDDRGAFDQQKFLIKVGPGPILPSVQVSDLDELFLETDEDVNATLKDLGLKITSDTSLTFDVYPYHGLEMGQAEIRENNDFHYMPDGNKSGTDHVFITVDDGNGAFYCVAVEILVHPVPDDPISLVASPVRIDENKKSIVKLEAYDGDEDETLRWTLDDPSDPLFKIVGETLYFKYAPDYENPYSLFPDNVYLANLTLWDKDNADPVPVQIEVIVENLPDTKPSSILVSSQQNYLDAMEGESLIALLEVSDPDGMQTPVVQIVGGRDAARFAIASNDLRVASNAVLDFENPVDQNLDNDYELQISIADDHLGDTYFVTVRITDRDETPPYFITGQGKNPYEIPVRENQQFVVQSIAKDSETTDLEFTVVGGSDEEFFKIGAHNGLLEFNHGQNYEYPADASNDGAYEVIIQVSDGTHETNQTIIARLTDVNDVPYVLGTDNVVPFFDPGSYSVTEDVPFSANFQVVDEDGDDFVLQYHAGVSHGTFDMNSKSFTYASAKDFNGTDSFVVKLADDQGSRTQTLLLKVLPVNDPPVAETDDPFYGRLSEELPLFFDLLENDHAGPDDPSEKQFYTVQIKTPPQYGSLEEEVGQPNLGRYFYTPQEGFIGEDVFEYTLMDASDPASSSTGLARVWIAKTKTLPQYTTLRNFGFYIESGTNWIYHLQMGWVYAQSLEDLYSSTWIWHDQIGWFWTGEKFFGWLYYHEYSKWLHWEGGVRETAGWLLRDTAQTVYDDSYFEKKVIRKEIEKILPNLTELSRYVQESEYFILSEKIEIVRQLNRYRRSDALDRILEFDFSY